jgi:hypothetical protein
MSGARQQDDDVAPFGHVEDDDARGAVLMIPMEALHDDNMSPFDVI